MAEHQKLVWIIGASSGIGASLAQLYAQFGWRVAVSARNEQKLKELAQDTTQLDVVPLDVTDSGQITAVIQQFHDAGKLPDLTVYCSGLYYPGGIDVLTEEHSIASMDTNYFGAVRVIEKLFPLLKEQGNGHIAIISSLSGYCGLPEAACYGPTKAALINLCESLKPDFDRVGLELSLVNPGFVKTPMTDKNTFDMPFLLTPEQAAKDIYKGLQRKSFEVYFPFRLGATMKVLRMLPYALYFPVMRRMSKR